MEGFEDPFNRGTFPWGKEDGELLAHFRRLGALRQARVSLQRGDIRYLYQEGCGLAFQRTSEHEATIAALNTGETPVEMVLPWAGPLATDALTGQQFYVWEGALRVILPPQEGMLLI